MPLSERDWTREPLPAERIEPRKLQISVDDLEDIELVYDGNYHIEVDDPPTLGWVDLAFWFFVLLIAQ
jgi:hypothetical protein